MTNDAAGIGLTPAHPNKIAVHNHKQFVADSHQPCRKQGSNTSHMIADLEEESAHREMGILPDQSICPVSQAAQSITGLGSAQDCVASHNLSLV